MGICCKIRGITLSLPRLGVTLKGGSMVDSHLLDQNVPPVPIALPWQRHRGACTNSH